MNTFGPVATVYKMSEKIPQVLARRANGVLPVSASQTKDLSKVSVVRDWTKHRMRSDKEKGKGVGEHATGRSARGKGSSEKSSDATQV